MTFYMDNSNDSETSAYSAALFAAAAQPSISADATGHSTLLAQYVLYPFAAVLQPVSGLYLIRGFVFARFVLGLALFGAAYAWYRHLAAALLRVFCHCRVGGAESGDRRVHAPRRPGAARPALGARQ